MQQPSKNPDHFDPFASEEIFQLMVSSVKDYAILMLDPQGNVITWNEGAQRINGYKADEIIGKHFSIFYTDEAKATQHPQDELKLALKDGRYEEDGWRVRKDGTHFWSRVTITPIRNNSGTLLGFVKVTRDLTEQKNREEERLRAAEELKQVNEKLKELNEELLRASKAKDIFLANMSHELRTPLNSIIGFNGVLLMELAGPLNEIQKKQAGYIQKAAEHLLSLINDILDLAKVESGRLELRTTTLNVCQLLSAVVPGLLPQARDRCLFLVLEPCAEVSSVCADERALRQIINNLVSNALKFTDHGGVYVRVSESAGVVSIAVQDTGIGISKEDQEKLFRGFTQLPHAERTQQGTGLGLVLSKRLANLMHGDITLISSPGVGSTFTLTLPAQGGHVDVARTSD